MGWKASGTHVPGRFRQEGGGRRDSKSGSLLCIQNEPAGLDAVQAWRTNVDGAAHRLDRGRRLLERVLNLQQHRREAVCGFDPVQQQASDECSVAARRLNFRAAPAVFACPAWMYWEAGRSIPAAQQQPQQLTSEAHAAQRVEHAKCLVGRGQAANAAHAALVGVGVDAACSSLVGGGCVIS